MANLLPAIALWLADYHLLAVALLLGVTIASVLLRQPAQRMALANATLASLAALALLSALPGWSLVHLMSEPAPAAPAAPTLASSPPMNFPVTPQFGMPSEAPSPAALTSLAAAPASPPIPAASAALVTWLALALALYASGSAAVVIWLITGAALAHRVRRQAMPAPPELQELLRQVCGAEKTPPELLLSPRVAAPAALGLRRPAIILPARSASSDPAHRSPFPIPPAQLLPILAHEWAHLRHRDLHTLAASRLLLVLLWPQPLFWLFRRTIRLDQEILADAAAADRAGRLDYAQQLLAWARTANTPRPPRLAGAVGLWEGPSQLKRRIAQLLNEQFNVMRSCSRRWRGGSLAALALLAIGLSTITLQPRAGVANDAQDETADMESPTSATGAPVAQPSKPIVAPAAPLPRSTRISGRFITDDGAQAEVRGQLEYVSTRVGLTSMGTAGRYTGTFSIEAPSGDVWLLYLTDEFAPAAVGPLRADGTPIDDVEVKLTAGFSVPIEVVNEQGQPVAGATISALANVSNGSIGTPVERTTDSQGRYLFEHVATLPYTIEVKARNYEPVRVDSVEFQPDVPVRYTLVPARPTSGVIATADGRAAGALLRFRAEVRPGHSTGGGTPYGDVVSTADAQGRFTLDGLATGSSYLYIAETADGARDWSPAVTAGEKDVVVRVHPRRDLRVRVVGDLDKLPKRNGKPYVSVRQRYEIKTAQGTHGDLVGEEAIITPTADGGEFTYQGLLPGEVEIAAGGFKTTVAVNEQGVTDATLKVAPKPTSATAKVAADEPANATPMRVAAAGDEAKLPLREAAPANDIYKPAEASNQSTTDVQLKVELAMAPVGVLIPSTAGAQVPPANATASIAVAETRHQSVGMATFALVPLKPAEPSTENANKFNVKVVDEQNAPLAGVEALIYRAAPHNAPGKPVLLRTLATDDAGKLLVTDLVSAEEVARLLTIKADGGFLGGLEGGYLIALRRPGLATAAIFQAAGPLGLYGADRTIKMHPAMKLSGQVTDPAGKPVAGATVIAGGDLFSGTAIEGVNAAVTDADGRYVFTDRAEFIRADAKEKELQLVAASANTAGRSKPPGDAPPEDPSAYSVSDLVVSHPDYAFTRVEGGDVPGVVDVQLLPAASITGRVVHDDSGAPVAGVIVHADEFPVVREIAPALEFRPHHSAVTTTDASGAYRIANLPAGRYDVWADSRAQEMSDAPWVSRGYGRIEASAGGEPAQVPDLVIGPPAVVQVQLVDAESGKPVDLPAGAKVTVAAESIAGPRLQITPQQRAAASTDGRFDMRLLPGRSRVLLFVHEGGLGSRAIWQSDDDVHSTGEVFDVKFGETTSATIPVLPAKRVEELRERGMAAYRLMEEKKYAEAIVAYTALIADFPKNHFRVLQQRADAHNRLGDFSAALADFESSLKLAPDNAGTKFWIAQLLATTPVDADRDSRRALEYAEQLAADARAPGVNPQWLASVLDIQAAAHADLGNFEKAIEIEQEAIKIGNQMQRKQMELRLELYKAKKTYHLAPPALIP